MKNRGILILLGLVLSVQAASAQNYRNGNNGQYVGSPGAGISQNPYNQHYYNPYTNLYQSTPVPNSNYYNAGNGQHIYAGQQYPYANQGGYGYYAPNPYATGYPAYGTPVPVNGNYFRFNVGGFSGSYWKSPSGYYYPWGVGGVYSAPPPVITMQQGESQPVQPPVTDMMKDMNTYLEEQNKNNKFKSDDYQHLARRLRDIQNVESSMRARNGGKLDPTDEDQVRKDLAMLSGDIVRRIIP
jgi:hypothetical protein